MVAKSCKKAAIFGSFSDPAQSVHTYKYQKALLQMKCHILTPNLGLKVGRGLSYAEKDDGELHSDPCPTLSEDTHK